MNEPEFIRQLDRWLEVFREEALVLFTKGVGPDRLMATAMTIADARLAGEVRKRQQLAIAPGATPRLIGGN